MHPSKNHRRRLLPIVLFITAGAVLLGWASIRAAIFGRDTSTAKEPAAGITQLSVDSNRVHPNPAAEATKVAMISVLPGKPPESAIKAGRAAFAANCAACHMANGTGSLGLIPPLADSDSFVRLSPEEITRNILAGRSGPIVANGASYNNVMPPMGYLPDKTVANIVTYVVNKWGQIEGQITDEHVSAVRAGG